MGNITVNRSNYKQNKLFEFLTSFYAAATAMVRGAEPTVIVFEGETDSRFIDKRGFTMVTIGPLPAALAGRNLDVLAAAELIDPDDPEAPPYGVPKYYGSSGYAVFAQMSAVAEGDIIVLQADTAALHYIGLRTSGAAVTCEVPVSLTA